METKPIITSERVDDIPLIFAELERMEVSTLLNSYFTPHGNWQGLSLGDVVVIWLTHILSQSDHRLNIVEDWASYRLESLSALLGKPVTALDFSDDRLASILKMFSDSGPWDEFESALSGGLLRIYDLSCDQVRLDSTSAAGYYQVSEEGLFQFGHSKDHRPDLPQVKVMLSSLDPLGLPVATDIVSGEAADDPLYIPAINKAQEILKRKGLLYIGDAKMAALETRGYTHMQGDYYLCPLPKIQMPSQKLAEYLQLVWDKDQPLTAIYRQTEAGESQQIAEGYERVEKQRVVIDGKTITWEERQLVIRSFKLAEAAATALNNRLQNAQQALLKLNERGKGKKVFNSEQQLQQAAEKILKKHRVQGLLTIAYDEQLHQRKVRAYQGKPSRIEEKREVRLSVAIDQIAYEKALRMLGWRVFVTNAQPSYLPLPKAVLAYRNEFIIEHNFSRLKGKPLSLRPMYLQRDDHILGLIRLLSIALRVLVLVEYILRRQLAKQQQTLQGLYAGNPKRTTKNPSTELVLRAFGNMTLTIIQQQRQTIRHLTELSDLQKQILNLLNFSVNIYRRLCAEFEIPD